MSPLPFVRVAILVERMTDTECAAYDPLDTGDPYWNRPWHPHLPPIAAIEGPSYVVAPDLVRLVQVHLSLSGSVPSPQIGACEIAALTDDEIPDIEGVRTYIRAEIVLDDLPTT